MYNGWTNHETWAKEAELANNSVLYTAAVKLVREATASSAKGTPARAAALTRLAVTMRSRFARTAAERTMVNWQELAETWTDNLESSQPPRSS